MDGGLVHTLSSAVLRSTLSLEGDWCVHDKWRNSKRPRELTDPLLTTTSLLEEAVANTPASGFPRKLADSAGSCGSGWSATLDVLASEQEQCDEQHVSNH